jgi:NADH-quinone oxidoreductase subunit M
VVYALKLVQASMLGANENRWALPDLTPREMGILGVLAAVILWLGLYPNPIFSTSRSSLRSVQDSLTSPEPGGPRAVP